MEEQLAMKPGNLERLRPVIKGNERAIKRGCSIFDMI
jgi:hypothetical protein